MYTLEEKAIHFVFKAFAGKKRNKQDIDSAVHSISVGYMLKDLHASETTIISGLLHDIIEDTDYDYEYILEHFGEEIADNVLMVTENIGIENYKERKTEFINRMNKASDEVVLLELADKLHNLISDYNLYLEDGKDIFTSSKVSFEDKQWYYLSFRKLFNRRLKENELLKRYNVITDIYFN